MTDDLVVREGEIEEALEWARKVCDPVPVPTIFYTGPIARALLHLQAQLAAAKRVKALDEETKAKLREDGEHREAQLSAMTAQRDALKHWHQKCKTLQETLTDVRQALAAMTAARDDLLYQQTRYRECIERLNTLLKASEAALLERAYHAKAALLEATAELIYLRLYGKDGAVWWANKSKDVWRDKARKALAEQAAKDGNTDADA